MLYRQHLLHELTARREEFVRFEREWAAGARAMAKSLRALGGRTAMQVKCAAEAEIEAGEARAAGALPATELDRYGSVIVPFGERWGSHEAARAWAASVLRGRSTCAADGSQILPGREISVPIAAVQIASFENPHTLDGTSYRKEARFHLVTPRELTETGDTAADVVGFLRFELELRALCEFCERHRGWRAEGRRVPVALFDGTLLLSSAQIRTESRFPSSYVNATLEAIRLSRETEVPLVGFIDHSYARDLVHLLGVLAGHRGGRTTTASAYDAQLFAAALTNDEKLLAAWGDRTIFFHCLREGLTREFRDEGDQPLVGFLYLQTTGEGAPARLDIPTWVYEAGLLEEVADVVRAECVVGNGYPYALETADGAAVLTMQDRAQFLRAVQDFAAEHDFSFRVSRKAVSKLRRR